MGRRASANGATAELARRVGRRSHLLATARGEAGPGPGLGAGTRGQAGALARSPRPVPPVPQTAGGNT